jgi:hypothetical protein
MDIITIIIIIFIIIIILLYYYVIIIHSKIVTIVIAIVVIIINIIVGWSEIFFTWALNNCTHTIRNPRPSQTGCMCREASSIFNKSPIANVPEALGPLIGGDPWLQQSAVQTTYWPHCQ